MKPMQSIKRQSCWAAGLLLMCLLLTGCSEPEPTVGKDTGFASACDSANKDQRIAVVGYLRFPESFSGSVSVVLRLYENGRFSGQPIGVTIKFGSQANRVAEVDVEYWNEDLLVHLAGGGTAGFGTPVKVSGTMYYPVVAQDFECGLSNVLVESAP
jgi:hypothetical protein